MVQPWGKSSLQPAVSLSVPLSSHLAPPLSRLCLRAVPSPRPDSTSFTSTYSKLPSSSYIRPVAINKCLHVCKSKQALNPEWILPCADRMHKATKKIYSGCVLRTFSFSEKTHKTLPLWNMQGSNFSGCWAPQITLQTAVVHTNQVISSLNVTQCWTLKAASMTARSLHFNMESVMQITSAR